MKSLFTLSVMALLVLAVMPAVLAVSVGSGIGVDIVTEDFAPLVWMCDNRVVVDDAVQWGRVSKDDQGMLERGNNYAFEGELSIRFALLQKRSCFLFPTYLGRLWKLYPIEQRHLKQLGGHTSIPKEQSLLLQYLLQCLFLCL